LGFHFCSIWEQIGLVQLGLKPLSVYATGRLSAASRHAAIFTQ